MKVPLLLDGAADPVMRQRGMNSYDCTAEWIISHPDIIKPLYESYAENGSDIICTATADANLHRLKQYGLENKMESVNQQLCEMLKPYCTNGIKMAGVVSTTNHLPEPFGDEEFLKLFYVFLEQANILKKSGADILWVQAMTSLAEMRAAVIACKRTGLPVYASVTLESDGQTKSGATPLSCLICMQALGVEAFGFEYCDYRIISDAVHEIAPYAEIPVIARPDAGLEDARGIHNMSGCRFAEIAAECIKSGASLIGGGDGTQPEHILALRHMIEDKNITVPEIEKCYDESQILVSSAAQPFFLNADSIETSEPLVCSQDMADEIIDINESNLDVITVEIQNYDDAFLFSQNSHYVSLPVMFKASNKLALETALLLYNGKALIDRTSDIDEDELRHIERKYGALIY